MNKRATKFYNRVMAEYDLRPDEEVLLEEICGNLDAIDVLKKRTPSGQTTRLMFSHRNLLASQLKRLDLKDPVSV